MIKVESRLNYFASYTINGNLDYMGRGKMSVTNGAYTVSVVKIDVNTFCLKSFLKERESCSNVFDLDANAPYSDKLEKLIELFPHADLIAN